MFGDRRDAGIRLARELGEFKDRKDAIILALPRGVVVVAYEIAHALHVPLDAFVVRKLGFPGRPELALFLRCLPRTQSSQSCNPALY